MPKVSVIIPVYNVEPYLRRCLDSVCNQTLRDIEIICINDCSPDNSLDILHEYAKNDNRMKIIDFVENKGVSVARNEGIDKAQGEYIGFVDSDDFVDLDFYEKLYNKALQTGAEIVVGNVLEDNMTMYEEIINSVKKNKANFAQLFTTAIYKKNLLNKYNIKFIENCSYCEDRIVPVKASLLCNKIEIEEAVFYHYERRNNSVTAGRLSEKNIKDYALFLNNLLQFINNADISKQDCMIVANIFLNNSLELLKKIDVELQQELCNSIKQFYNLYKYKDDTNILFQEVYKLLLENNIEKILSIVNKSNKQKMLDVLKSNLIRKQAINDKKIKVSIIIPVYNAQDYLKRCLDSVCNQTLKDIEIICINDCSPDNSLQILNEYSDKYSNLKVIDCKINGGESVARNIGLDLAQGEYIAFVDNDDEVDLDFYEKLYNKGIEAGADIVKAGVHVINYDGSNYYSSANDKINDNKFYFVVQWWTAIYKRCVVQSNNIRFLVGCPLGGDVLFLNEVVIKANKVEVANGCFYHYYRREDSGDSKLLSLVKIKASLDVFERIINNLNVANIAKINPEGYDYVYNIWQRESFVRFLRNNEYECKCLCAEMAIKIYNLCQRKKSLKLFSEFPCIKKFIVEADAEGLVAFMSVNTSYSKLMIATFRENAKRNLNLTKRISDCE